MAADDPGAGRTGELSSGAVNASVPSARGDSPTHRATNYRTPSRAMTFQGGK